MLLLTRREGESVVVGPGVTITVQSVGSVNVRLAIQASRSVRILRSETISREAGRDRDELSCP